MTHTTAQDDNRIFQALCTELDRLEAAGIRKVGQDSIDHTRALRDQYAAKLNAHRATCTNCDWML